MMKTLEVIASGGWGTLLGGCGKSNYNDSEHGINTRKNYGN